MKKIIISIVVILIIIGSIFIVYALIKKDNNQTPKVDDIYKKYINNEITIDEYVRNILDNSSSSNNIDNFIYDNYDKLDKSTINYYIEKINLTDITFEIDKENSNDVSISDIFIPTVSAKEKITNLNHVVLSKNNNFIIWYTTTGTSKTALEVAQKLADGLEESLESYRITLGKEYQFESKNLNKGKRYENMANILTTNNIDTKYLDEAMQVYLVEYDDTALARYVTRRTASKLSSDVQEFFKTDINGAIAQPYILIKPSSMTNYETLNQLYNHELFHHYQYEVLCGHFACELSDDPYILEATANWASSLITPKTTNEGFLNDWAGSALNHTDNFLSKSMIQEYGETTLGYGLFVYLANYSSNVENGIKLILDSIYKHNSLKYLYNNASQKDLVKVSHTLAVNNIKQDYSNKNLNAAPSFEAKLPIKQNITNDDIDHNINRTLNPLGIEYYKIDKNNLKAELKINNDIAAFLINVTDDKIEIVDQATYDDKQYTFNLNNYENAYLAIANLELTEELEYSITFKEKKENFISFDDCLANLDDELIKQISTYYYDDNGIVYKIRFTLFFADGVDVRTWLTDPVSYTNFVYGDNTIRFDYKDEVIKKYLGEPSIVTYRNYFETFCGKAEVDYDPGN